MSINLRAYRASRRSALNEVTYQQNQMRLADRSYDLSLKYRAYTAIAAGLVKENPLYSPQISTLIEEALAKAEKVRQPGQSLSLLLDPMVAHAEKWATVQGKKRKSRELFTRAESIAKGIEQKEEREAALLKTSLFSKQKLSSLISKESF